MQPEKVVATGLLLAALIGTPLGALGDPPAMASAPSATSEGQGQASGAGVTPPDAPSPQAAEPLATQPAPADGEGAPELQEVIVTAQKREESLQKTPISIVAFDAYALQAHGISGVNDLNNNLPGLTAEPFPTDDSTLRIFIRGV